MRISLSAICLVLFVFVEKASKNYIVEGIYVDMPTTPAQSLQVVECPSDRPLPHLSLSKSFSALRIQDKIKVTFEHNNEVGSVSNIIRESLVSELHKIFSRTIKEKDFSTKKPKVESLLKNLLISDVSNGESPAEVPKNQEYQKTDEENLEIFLEDTSNAPSSGFGGQTDRKPF